MVPGAIAVFMETWLSGGFGRILGNFDEMYFRTMVLDKKKFPTPVSMESVYSPNSFLLESIYYLYGTRFIAHLALKYGVDKTISWFKFYPGIAYATLEEKFKYIFGLEFSDAWKEFIKDEIKFQKENIKKLETAELTPVKVLSRYPVGWVTKAYYDSSTACTNYGYNKPHRLASIEKLGLENGVSEVIGTIPTPNLLQVASTAFDKKLGLFFYTTNNNQFYRDIWVTDTYTGEKRKSLKM